MDDKILQFIFDKIEPFLPQEWKQVVFYSEYTEGSYSMRFYSECGNNNFIDCFSLPGISKASLIRLFMDINKVLGECRKDNPWTALTMKVNSNGQMKADLEYENHSEDILSFREKWEARYLS